MERYESKAETNAFDAMVSRFNIAAEKLKLDEGLYQILLTPDREIGGNTRPDGQRKLKVFKGYRAHSLARDRWRYPVAPDVTLDEVRSLAAWMT
jgi:glutamate dehydrogenase (NAD(P)+)